MQSKERRCTKWRENVKRRIREEMKRVSTALSSWSSQCKVELRRRGERGEERKRKEMRTQERGMYEQKKKKGKERKAKQGMHAKFQIDRVDPSNLPIKRPLAKTKAILTVSHNTDFPAHSVPMSVLPNSTKHSLHHPTWLQCLRT